MHFCDGNTDRALTLDEFTAGIVNDAKDLDDEVFTRDWLERMSSCIAELKSEKNNSQATPERGAAGEDCRSQEIEARFVKVLPTLRHRADGAIAVMESPVGNV